MINEFEQKYQKDPDPWNFAGSEYEKSRYAATIASLGGRHFQSVLEPGCSIGVLTEQLAAICAHVDAFDISKTAVAKARRRCALLNNVLLTQESVADFVPTGSYDLLVLSEIGYYFNPPHLAAIASRLLTPLLPGGLLLGVHWLGYSEDHKLSGDQVHDLLHALPGLQQLYSRRYPGFLLEQWTKI